MPHKKLAVNTELYAKWTDIKSFLPQVNTAKTSKISFWTGSGGVSPYFVASGGSSPAGNTLLSTGLTTPGNASSYPDFPRIACYIGICTIAYQGMTILSSDFITTNNHNYTGIVYVDFYGDDLLTMIHSKNNATYARCTATQVQKDVFYALS